VPPPIPQAAPAGSMHAGARAFVPGAASLSAQMGRMRVGGGGGGFQPPPPSGAPGAAWQGGGAYAYAAGQPGEPEEEDWGYEDEQGNWVSFNDGNEEVEFLKSQLPSEDDFLDGLGADTGPHLEGEQGEGDDWGYYDDQGQWVSFGGETNEYLQAAGQAR
jgi:E3 ubiquitin-protein ligase makorin